MFDFLTKNSSEIMTILVSILATVIPIPIIVKDILKRFNENNKTKIEIKDAEKKLMELTVSKDKLDSIINSAININEDGEENASESTSPYPKSPKFDFHVTYSSKKTTLGELYEKRNTDKFLKKISFTLAVIMSVIGTIILFVGILISLFTEKEVGWITTSSGAIIELVAGVYFWLVNRTMKEVKDNSKQLEKTEDLLTAIELVEKINDVKTKDDAYINIIDKLLPKSNK